MNIETRLERLEKQMRFYRRLVVILALVIVAGVSMGQARSDIVDVLKCRKLEVYNPTGSIAAVISADDGGYLSLRNKEGKAAAVIAAVGRLLAHLAPRKPFAFKLLTDFFRWHGSRFISTGSLRGPRIER